MAQSLLGCLFISEIGGKSKRSSGFIVETEAYQENDPASHAYQHKRGPNPCMGHGKAYIYLIWKTRFIQCGYRTGGVAGSVLIRALHPVEGIKTMHHRRTLITLIGSDNLTQALILQSTMA